MKYFVALNLNRDCRDYVPGDTIDLAEDVASGLLAASVLSIEPVEAKDLTPEQPQEEVQPNPVVGGSPETSGEPSLDTPGGQPASTGEAKDLTPILEDLKRDELEALAVEKGVSAEDAANAPNKGAVIELIKAASAPVDPSANL